MLQRSLFSISVISRDLHLWLYTDHPLYGAVRKTSCLFIWTFKTNHTSFLNVAHIYNVRDMTISLILIGSSYKILWPTLSVWWERIFIGRWTNFVDSACVCDFSSSSSLERDSSAQTRSSVWIGIVHHVHFETLKTKVEFDHSSFFVSLACVKNTTKKEKVKRDGARFQKMLHNVQHSTKAAFGSFCESNELPGWSCQ